MEIISTCGFLKFGKATDKVTAFHLAHKGRLERHEGGLQASTTEAEDSGAPACRRRCWAHLRAGCGFLQREQKGGHHYLCATKHSPSHFKTWMNVTIKSQEKIDFDRSGDSFCLCTKQHNSLGPSSSFLSPEPLNIEKVAQATLWQDQEAAVGYVIWQACRMGSSLPCPCLPGALGRAYTVSLCALGQYSWPGCECLSSVIVLRRQNSHNPLRGVTILAN